MNHKTLRGIRLSALLFTVVSVTAAMTAPARALAEDWLDHEAPIAVTKMLANISPAGTRPGVVIASPSRTNPDYYFHWIRDSALVMEVVAKTHGQLDLDGSLSNEKLALRKMLLDFADFSHQIQNTHALTGLGEPKFNVDGSSFTGPWARPQNDGPALRAITLIQFAEQLMNEGQGAFVKTFLYDGKLPSKSTIKADLEYVANHWKLPSFDLWEETKGDHFYTRMVQRKALLLGSSLAARLGDSQASAWYLEQARALQKEIEKHWDASKGIIVATLNRVGGIDYKGSGIDSAVVLGVLHGDAGDGFFSVKDFRVQATMKVIEDAFRRLYPINSEAGVPGVAIGRYPEDRYAGTDFNGGNPWVLSTLAFAEAHYRAATEFAKMGDPRQSDEHLVRAGEFVGRVQKYVGPDGSMAEQIQRVSGKLMSASDLTWNYAAVLTTYQARQAAHARRLAR